MQIAEDVYPILSRPVLKAKIWGGRKLETLYGIDLPEDQKIGEAWMVADLAEGASSVGNGSCAGLSLHDLTRDWGEAMIGSAWSDSPTDGRFPLLIKFLDANADLSVQVHPGPEDCRDFFPEAFSKDESWVVVHNDPGGTILHGFRPEVTLEDFNRELAEGRVVDTMRRVEVQPGDVFRVVPGTVHALCSGVAILEIQEPSDTTFRIYDYDRPGDDGQPRALHLDAAKQVMRFGDTSAPQCQPVKQETDGGTFELLVDVPAYRIERVSLSRALDWSVDPRSVQVLIVLEGGAELAAGGERLALHAGDTVILPAQLGEVSLRSTSEKILFIMAGAGGVPMAPAV